MITIGIFATTSYFYRTCVCVCMYENMCMYVCMCVCASVYVIVCHTTAVSDSITPVPTTSSIYFSDGNTYMICGNGMYVCMYVKCVCGMCMSYVYIMLLYGMNYESRTIEYLM